MTSVYHEGELAAQERAGVREMAARVGRGIHGEIPPVAAAFLGEQRMLFAAARDGDGQPWATVLTGPPGFLAAEDERTVRIDARAPDGDPAAAGLADGAQVGLLAIDFRTRRRMRVNGVVETDVDGGLRVRAAEVYANCPKYIQARAFDGGAGEPDGPPPPVRRAGLTDAHRAWIASADTFVIATAHPSRGADVSHRGGAPGFVRVEGNALTWGDYAGNMMFNTLGNLVVEPRAGLLFVDFARGRTLQLSGRARIDWDAHHAAAVPGAERLVTFDVAEAVEREGVPGLGMRFLDASPFNPVG